MSILAVTHTYQFVLAYCRGDIVGEVSACGVAAVRMRYVIMNALHV